MFSAAMRPTTTISSCSARSAVTSAAIRFQRVTEKPMMLRVATYTMIANAITSSTAPDPASPQNVAR